MNAVSVRANSALPVYFTFVNKLKWTIAILAFFYFAKMKARTSRLVFFTHSFLNFKRVWMLFVIYRFHMWVICIHCTYWARSRCHWNMSAWGSHYSLYPLATSGMSVCGLENSCNIKSANDFLLEAIGVLSNVVL